MKNKNLNCLLLLFPVIILLLGGCSLKNITESRTANAEFDRFTDELFAKEVSGNTINLHYTIANPENFGIGDYPITLGNFSLEGMEQSMENLDSYLSALDAISYQALSNDRQLTYDCIYEKLKTERQASEVLSYTEILSASTGFQAQLPVLLAEYAFYDNQDVEDYLLLLEQIRPYFQQILEFEREKARQGLFMPSYAAEDIIAQCTSLIADTKTHFLISTFEGRLDGLSLTEEERTDYITRNQKALDAYVFPAYADLIRGLTDLKDQGQNPYGLCYYPKGRQYYSYLVAANTGSSFSVDELNGQILNSLTEALALFAKELENTSSPTEETGTKAISQTGSTDIISVDPKEYLEDLQEKAKQDFPSLFQVNYTLHDIDSSLEDFLSPAFYLTPALDNSQNNVIYLNRAHNYTPLSLYTTLAHEGFPGHLYQNVYTRTLGQNKIRALFGTTGYAEGWATYGEMLSYSYAEIDQTLAQLYRSNSQITLALSAALDIGIHYNYWTPDDAYDFLNTYGFADREAADRLYRYIVEEPANYLNYYVGYLEFMRLKEIAETLQGEHFELKKFHETILNIGEAPFSVVEKYLRRTLEDN